MYAVNEMIALGRGTMDENKGFDIDLGDFIQLRDCSKDRVSLANNAFLLGVAIGLKIGEGERADRD